MRYAELLAAKGRTWQSAEWLKRAAGRGGSVHFQGRKQLHIARTYGRGDGTGVEAERWFREAARSGAWEAFMELGFRQDIEGEKDKADGYFETAVAKGGATAAMVIGATLWGDRYDAASAIKWLRRAGKLNDQEAMSVLGRAYTEGIGTPRDLEEAFAWYRAAADHKGSQSGDLLLLAQLLDKGTGTKRDPYAALEAVRAAKGKWIDDSDSETPRKIKEYEERLTRELSSATN